MNSFESKIKEEVSKINKLPQCQDSTSAQLELLIPVANKLGLYDAADAILEWIKKTKK